MMYSRVQMTLHVCAVIVGILVMVSFKQPGGPANAMAPPNVKIDGKATEWGEIPLLKDKSGKVEYLLANDAKNLYVLFSSSDPSIIARVMLGGLTFAVNPEGKKKATFAFTYPFLNQQKTQEQMMRMMSSGVKPEVRQLRKQLSDQLTVIGIKGVPEIESDHISVYNTLGIKIALDVDESNTLWLEAAIPLTLVKLNPLFVGPAAYQFKINGLKVPDMHDGPPVEPPAGGMAGGMPPGSVSALFQSSDFWVKQFPARP